MVREAKEQKLWPMRSEPQRPNSGGAAALRGRGEKSRAEVELGNKRPQSNGKQQRRGCVGGASAGLSKVGRTSREAAGSVSLEKRQSHLDLCGTQASDICAIGTPSLAATMTTTSTTFWSASAVFA